MTTALAPVPANPFEPQNIPQAMELANAIARSGLVPSALRGKPADVLIILMTSRELGIGPMQGLSDINVIQGKPVFSADLMVAQCKRRTNRCEYFILIESTDDHATYEAKAVGAPAPERYTFTVKDAEGLHLLEKDNWKKQRKTMLRRRAAAACAREVFPDLVRGYDPDEAEDFSKRAPVHIPPTSGPTADPAEFKDVTPPADPPTDAAAAPSTASPESAKPVPNPGAMAIWKKLREECKTKEEAQAKFDAATTDRFGALVATHLWTDDDCLAINRALFDIPF